MSDDRIAALLARTGSLVLADDHAPVENLVAAVVRDSAEAMALDEWRRAGQRLFRQGHFEKAIATLKKGLARDPSQVSLLLLLGNAQLAVEQPADAADSFTRALKALETATAHSGLAFARAQQGRLDEAEANALAAVKLNPADGQTIVLLATIQARLKHWDDAFASFAEAVRLRPDNAEAYFDWGAALAIAGRPDEALEKYGAALRIKPELAEAHLSRGDLLLKLKRYDEAIAAYRAHLKLRPGNADAQFNIGNAYYYSNKLDEAAQAYFAAITINANYKNAFLNVALIRESQGRLEEAQRYCELMIQARPDDAEARRLLQRIVAKRRSATTRGTPASGS